MHKNSSVFDIEEQAKQRVKNTPELAKYYVLLIEQDHYSSEICSSDTIVSDEEWWLWLATAPTASILREAREIERLA